MKKDGQQVLVDNLLPTMDDKDGELERKLDEIAKLSLNAKRHDKLLKEAKEKIKGFVLGLSEADQAIGQVCIGAYTFPFSTKEVEEGEVKYTTTAGTKVTLKIVPDDDGGEGGTPPPAEE